MTSLKFATFTSQLDMPFYSAFFASKLDHDKLDESARPILGLYEPRRELAPAASTRMQIHGNALTSTQAPLGTCRGEGIIKNFNKIEDFKQFDKAALMQQAGRQLWDAIKDGSIYEIPSLLASFRILSFADLKKYKFTYWFAFPALQSKWNRIGDVGHLEAKESAALVDRLGTWRYANDSRQHGFFLAKRKRPGKDPVPKSPRDFLREPLDEDDLGFTWDIGLLGDYDRGFFNEVDQEDRYAAFVDSSTYEDAPSWPLRNLLMLIRHRYGLSKAQILCYRDTQAKRDENRSIVLSVEMEDGENADSTEMPKVSGWERTDNNKLQARLVNLADYLDPKRVADQAVDLNLKLMKWRISPNLDLDAIKNTSCLLLGAGTLGGFVSRNLMAWGVRKITLVDNGSVSFSNPVRQPLFEFKDCLEGGAAKAVRAAESLRLIYPGVQAEGHVLSVPMLGHPMLDEAKTKADFERLEQLVEEHDAIFLLMDTRESRWLPTVMGKAKGKIVMNAALGFDTYVVMRHGAAPNDGTEDTLGCYFCNDVVTPANSVKDQTLDQQCTVTRPGVAAIASALLVELLTSILQHPQKHHANAPSVRSKDGPLERDPEDHALGIVPHQIRGFLANFENVVIRGQSYPNCSACSTPITYAYKNDGWAFVKKALEDRDYVTELSGLAEIQRKAVAMMADDDDWGADDDGDDGEPVLL